MSHLLQTPKTVYSSTVDVLRYLIQARSITPSDAGTLNFLATQLQELDFTVEQFICNGVKNLIARRTFGEGPTLAYSGHVDVVPAQPAGWRVDPFSGQVIDGVMYGRGAADMKGSIAAMLSATRHLCSMEKNKPNLGTFYWLITSDEEGEAEYGSLEIARYLQHRGVILDACLVGEPTSGKIVGDTIKNGRRGAISGRITINGKAGHVAYPENTINAAHIAGELVTQLAQLNWQKDVPGSQTTLQVTGITVPNIVDNLVPASCEITFNIRYSHAYKSKEVCEIVKSVTGQDKFCAQLQWERPCESFYTGKKAERCFLSLVEHAISKQLGHFPALSTAGGTSDGRFFANADTQVVECGVKNDSIHQVNEHVSLGDLDAIEGIYLSILRDFFVPQE
ncbi:succinyl-diaminopimelate desuccinylase [Pseudoalteromonas luteoviolacea]|uniref:succinyl-diaminopimelate desuccinylase n=1 Tax=Pseudoalteromonas luteoviolacea TaxID=43657 RepID=UPI00114EDD40|nr:succinyl-diaminopimelate desuccinylase [Pseudoalteromonas luteoviolacea]TQF73033.1 succinyl-diaminopimelate desuccinylase [Pseudoalteromonas luteoviolacea]